MTYAVLSSVLGKWVDKQLAGLKGNAVTAAAARDALKYIGGVQFSILAVVVILSTFIPRGALSFNPKLIEGHNSVDEEAAGEKAEVKEARDEKFDSLETSACDYPVYVNGAAVPEVTK